MQCPYCNQTHPDGAEFCPVTGQRLKAEKKNNTWIWIILGVIGIGFIIFGILDPRWFGGSITSESSFTQTDEDEKSIPQTSEDETPVPQIKEDKTSVPQTDYSNILPLIRDQIENEEKQLFTYGFDYSDTDGSWELAQEFVYVLDPNNNSDFLDLEGKIQISTNGRSRNPVWSPDGRFIAYVQYGSDGFSSGWIVIYDYESKVERTINGNFVPGDLSWSPDGKKIAFSDYKNDDVAVIDISTEAVNRVDTDGHWVDGPTWSLDGRYLAYVQTKGTDTNNDDAWVLKILDLETMRVSQITTENDNIGIMRDARTILWTVDGKYLVYKRFDLINGQRQAYELWILDPNSLETFRLQEDVYVVVQGYYPWILLLSPNDENPYPKPIEKYAAPWENNAN